MFESAADGKLWVSLTRFGDAELAALKAIPGHKWDPARKRWQFPDTPETRAALGEIVAMPPRLFPMVQSTPPLPMVAAITR